MPTIDDDFSDPEDLPLDAAPLPPPPSAPRAPQSGQPGGVSMNPMQGYKEVPAEMYKGWETLYPIYIDAKRPHQDGARRVSKEYALDWPLAEMMAKACTALGIQSVLEPQKGHPKDWANPGRVKVLIKEDGKPKNSTIKNKRILLQRICLLLKPNQPKPTTPGGLPPIEKRLPGNSPAISFGMLESSAKGGGMGGMLGNLLGGGAAEEEEEKPVEAPKKKEAPKPKMKKIHPKRR
ncbi:signal recognition particle, SRP19 subunit [Leucosporidium creatinivorum]|uniref:Signal recognition particle, SRP19 subunit n=1 Tax=Leucosporidium creatinivorum TaxID=106004 RepID=A0A1Y2FTX3_9BASI|nr:signal recognition particle, SRP19 subunit [Leucosporidium creatinivorum]